MWGVYLFINRPLLVASKQLSNGEFQQKLSCRWYDSSYEMYKCTNSAETKQTSAEISFLGSPKNSISYSIARFFYQTAILCCHKKPSGK